MIVETKTNSKKLSLNVYNGMIIVLNYYVFLHFGTYICKIMLKISITFLGIMRRDKKVMYLMMISATLVNALKYFKPQDIPSYVKVIRRRFVKMSP